MNGEQNSAIELPHPRIELQYILSAQESHILTLDHRALHRINQTHDYDQVLVD